MTETKTKQCGETAICLISWAGRQIPRCQKHANQLQAVANAMGTPAEATHNYDLSVLCTSMDKEQTMWKLLIKEALSFIALICLILVAVILITL